MNNIFGKIWLVWSLIAFVFTAPFIYLAYVIVYYILGGEKKYVRGFAVTKVWGKVVNFFIGLRIKTFGQEKLDKDGLYIYVCNHQSQLDIPINFSTNNQPFVILSKQEVLKIPIVATNLKNAHVVVNRNDKNSRAKVMDELADHLKVGRSVLIYPEGRRNRSTELMGEFKKGAFKLAIQHKLPIVPITIVGSDKINNPVNPFSIKPGIVKVYYDQPIPTNQLNLSNIDDLIETTRAKMLQHF